MPDFESASTKQLEELCGPHLVQLYRLIHKDPQAPVYRAALIKSLSKPELPIDPVLDAVRNSTDPAAAYREVISICQSCAPKAPWDELPTPDIERDIAAARAWLGAELERLEPASGIYLGLDTLNMRGGHGKNVEIGGSSQCDPLQDSQDWVWEKLAYGGEHLIRGLYELRTEYAKEPWNTQDESIPCGSARSLAEYVLFLSYSGIVLGHAFMGLRLSRSSLAVWGYHDGDLFLLGRGNDRGFSLLCK